VCLCVKSTRHPWRCTPTSGWATLSSWTRSIWSSLSRTSRSGESSCTDCPQVVSHLQRRVCIHKQCMYSMPQCRSFLALYIADPLSLSALQNCMQYVYFMVPICGTQYQMQPKYMYSTQSVLCSLHDALHTVLKVYNRNI
jgi:hypothetical protein